MTQEDKELLLKDICSRLPYKQVCIYKESSYEILGCLFNKVNISKPILSKIKWVDIEDCKPYLRSMDSMTEEEYVYFTSIRGMNLRSCEIQEMMSENFSHPNRIAIVNTLGRYSHNIDWLNERMFDYRGLIERGLATEAPEGMYKIN